MKKMVFFAIGIFFTMAGFSQVSFGVQAIGNIGDAQVKNSAASTFNKTMIGMPGAGVVVQYDLPNKIGIRTGVNYLQQGLELDAVLDPTVDLRAKAENTLHYLQVPLNVTYTFPVGNVKLYAGAGGYFGYGIAGKSKQTTRMTMPDGNEEVTVEDLKAFKKEEDGGAGLKKIDAGAGALAGIRLNNGLFVNLGYQLGLANISDGDGKYKNRSFQLSVGYFF